MLTCCLLAVSAFVFQVPPLPTTAASFLPPTSSTALAKWIAEPDRPGFFARSFALGLGGQFDVQSDEGLFRFALSPDGKRAARTVRSGSSFAVEVDLLAGPKFDEILSDPGLVWSPDSQHLAYVARRAAHQFVVLDGVEGPRVDRVTSDLRFHPLTGKLAYLATVQRENGRDMASAVFFDQKSQGDHPHLMDFLLSPLGDRVAFHTIHSLERGVQNLVVSADMVIEDAAQLAFGPDGRCYAVATRGEKQHLVVEGELGEAFDFVELPVFAATGSAYAVRVGSATEAQSQISHRSEYRSNRLGFTWEVLFGDQRMPQGIDPFAPNPPTIALSEDGSRCAFVDVHESGSRVVLDGKPGSEYDRIEHLCFDPSGVCSYIASKGGYVFHVRDGVEDDGRAGKFLRLHQAPTAGRFLAEVLLATGATMCLTDQGAHAWSGTCQPGSVVWSEDGQHLAYQLLPYDNQPETALLILDGEVFAPTSQPGRPASYVRPDFTPNGRTPWWLNEQIVEPSGPGQARTSVQVLYKGGAPLASLPRGPIEQLSFSDDEQHFACWLPLPSDENLRQLVFDGRIVSAPLRLVATPCQRTPDAWYCGSNDGPHPAAGHFTAQGSWEFLTIQDGKVQLVSYALADLVAAK